MSAIWLVQSKFHILRRDAENVPTHCWSLLCLRRTSSLCILELNSPVMQIAATLLQILHTHNFHSARFCGILSTVARVPKLTNLTTFLSPILMYRASAHDDEAKKNSGEFACYNKPLVLIYTLIVMKHSKLLGVVYRKWTQFLKLFRIKE